MDDSTVDHGHRAVLQLESTLLQSLCQLEGWDAAELHTGRRLVRFNKVQDGYTLNVTCERISQQDYRESDIVVSCIYREEQGSCCVTSVDIISLLEKLVDDEFEVEEKNRIRRNLEGYRPTTISKHRLGFEDFFQRIMDFPDPKPRNIEKDVKVFDWNLLPEALKKIISKYVSASVPSLIQSDRHPGPQSLCSTEENKTELKEPPKTEDTPSSSLSNSEVHHSKMDVDNQSPKVHTEQDKMQISYSQDDVFPATYVNPAVVNKYYVARPNDVIFMPQHTTDLSHASSDTPFEHAADTSDSLNDASHSDCGDWDMTLVKVESPEDLGNFDALQPQAGNNAYLVDGYGLSTFDSLEFQTLREHNVACSHSLP